MKKSWLFFFLCPFMDILKVSKRKKRFSSQTSEDLFLLKHENPFLIMFDTEKEDSELFKMFLEYKFRFKHL